MTMNAMTVTPMTQSDLDAAYANVRLLNKALGEILRRVGFKKKTNLMAHAASGVTVSTLGNRTGVTLIAHADFDGERMRTIVRVTTVTQIEAFVAALPLNG